MAQDSDELDECRREIEALRYEDGTPVYSDVNVSARGRRVNVAFREDKGRRWSFNYASTFDALEALRLRIVERVMHS